jgi:hypothetical protein
LDRDTGDGSEASAWWRERVQSAAREALRATARGMGGRSDTLKALSKAEGVLERGLAFGTAETPPTEETTTEATS